MKKRKVGERGDVGEGYKVDREKVARQFGALACNSLPHLCTLSMDTVSHHDAQQERANE